MSMRHNHDGHCAHSTPEAVQVRVSFTPVGRPRTGGVDGSKMKSCFCASSSPSSASANVPPAPGTKLMKRELWAAAPRRRRKHLERRRARRPSSKKVAQYSAYGEKRTLKVL